MVCTHGQLGVANMANLVYTWPKEGLDCDKCRVEAVSIPNRSLLFETKVLGPKPGESKMCRVAWSVKTPKNQQYLLYSNT